MEYWTVFLFKCFASLCYGSCGATSTPCVPAVILNLHVPYPYLKSTTVVLSMKEETSSIEQVNIYRSTHVLAQLKSLPQDVVGFGIHLSAYSSHKVWFSSSVSNSHTTALSLSLKPLSTRLLTCIVACYTTPTYLTAPCKWWKAGREGRLSSGSQTGQGKREEVFQNTRVCKLVYNIQQWPFTSYPLLPSACLPFLIINALGMVWHGLHAKLASVPWKVSFKASHCFRLGDICSCSVVPCVVCQFVRLFSSSFVWSALLDRDATGSDYSLDCTTGLTFDLDLISGSVL